MPRSRTVWRGGKIVLEAVDGKVVYLAEDAYDTSKRSDAVAAPHYVRDIGEYRSPIDGTMITSRSVHRDHLKAHDVIEVGNERVGSMGGPVEAVREPPGLGEAIKRRIEEVKELPQHVYDTQVATQQVEHAEVAALVADA